MNSTNASKFLALTDPSTHIAFPIELTAINNARSNAMIMLVRMSAEQSTTLARLFLDKKHAGTIVVSAL